MRLFDETLNEESKTAGALNKIARRRSGRRKPLEGA
jgi:hypothetical protein